MDIKQELKKIVACEVGARYGLIEWREACRAALAEIERLEFERAGTFEILNTVQLSGKVLAVEHRLKTLEAWLLALGSAADGLARQIASNR
jgi:hypothetical protein